MNAIEAQKKMDWKSSVAMRPSMSVPVAPMAAYKFNSKMVFDEQFRDAARVRVAEFLTRYGLPTWSATKIDDVALAGVTPDATQLHALNELHEALRGTSLDHAVAMERGLAEEGHGLPAIAVLVLVVAIAVAVFVVQQNVAEFGDEVG